MPENRARAVLSNADRVWQHFSPDTLRTICTMPERAFPKAYGMTTHKVKQRAPHNFYAYQDNGSDILAVAHLDTVADPDDRACGFIETAAGWVVYSRALDDRLGAYIILDLLPKLGMQFDVLLTVGEEIGQSTAAFFEPVKDYNWLIEFDRGGTDVVMYQYEDEDTKELVEDTGAIVAPGIFSDISYLEHLEVKAFNWGVGYRDYHSPRSHAYLDDTVMMLGHFMDFHAVNADVRLPHDPTDALYAAEIYTDTWPRDVPTGLDRIEWESFDWRG